MGRRTVPLAAIALAAWAPAALAQACLALPPLASAGLRAELQRSAHKYARGGGGSVQIFPGHSIILIPRSGWLRDSEQAITAFELGLRFGVAVDDGSRVCPTSSVERTVAVLNPLHPDQLNTIIDATLGLALGKLGRWRGVEVRGSVSGEFGRVSVSPYSDDTWGDFYQLLTARGAIGLSRRLDLRVAVSVPINLSEPGLPNRDLVVPFGREEKELGTVLGVGIKIL